MKTPVRFLPSSFRSLSSVICLVWLLLGLSALQAGDEGPVLNVTETSETRTSITNTHIPITQNQSSEQVVQREVFLGDRVLLVGTRLDLDDPQVQNALRIALEALNAQKPGGRKGIRLVSVRRGTYATGDAGTTKFEIVFVRTDTSTNTFDEVTDSYVFIEEELIEINRLINHVTVVNQNNIYNDITTGTTLQTIVFEYERLFQLDLGAVYSALYSGLPIALSQRWPLVGAHRLIIGDVNDRLGRLRLGGTDQPQGDMDSAGGKSSKGVLGDLDDDVSDQFSLFASGDFGWQERGPVSSAAGLDADWFAGSVGAEWHFAEHWRAGIAGSYVYGDVDFDGGLGGERIEGGAASAYINWAGSGSYVDLLYSIGSFDVDLARRTLVSGTAHGDTNALSNAVALETGHVWQLGGGFSTGPMLAISYVNGNLDGFEERGGGSAALSYTDQDYESLVTYVGWQAALRVPTGWGAITPIGRVAWEREHLNDEGDAGVSLLQSPFGLVTNSGLERFGGFGVTASRPSAQRDALVVGGGARIEIGRRWWVTLDGEAHIPFDGDVDVFAAVRAGCRF